MKTAQSNTRLQNTTLHISSTSPPEVKVLSKQSTTASRLNKIRRQSNDGEIVFLLKSLLNFHFDDVREKTKREMFKPTSLTTQHLRRSRRDAITDNLQTTDYTLEDLSMCNDSIINIKYDEHEVWNNFSIFYKNKVYDYTEYRALNDGIKICNSTDANIRKIWKLRNDWVKQNRHFESCKKPELITFVIIIGRYTVLKDFTILILQTKQIITKYNYGVFQGRAIICLEKVVLPIDATNLVAPLCALALSLLSLLLLLIVYCMLPELRTLPGLNLMSLSFALLIWLVYVVAMLSPSLHESKLILRLDKVWIRFNGRINS